MMSRRRFIKTTGLATLGFGWIKDSSSLFSSSLQDLGLHLATVQDALVANPQATIEAIYQAGYRQVELSDTQLLPKLQPIFQGLNIAVNSSYILPPLITGNWNPLTAFGIKPPPTDYSFEKAVEQAAQYGVSYLVFPTVYPQDRGGIEVYQQLARKLNEAGEVCQRANIQLAYQHHAFEFHPMEDTSAFEILMNDTDPTLLKLEVDPFWLSVGGLNPVQFIREYADRVKLLHLQDMKSNTPQSYLAATLPDDSFQPVGAGTIDFAQILKIAQTIGVAHYFVTQNKSDDPLADVRQSARYLKNIFE